MDKQDHDAIKKMSQDELLTFIEEHGMNDRRSQLAMALLQSKGQAEIQSKLDQLKKTHWTVIPGFCIALLVMFFAGVATSPLIKSWFTAKTSPPNSRSAPDAVVEPKGDNSRVATAWESSELLSKVVKLRDGMSIGEVSAIMGEEEFPMLDQGNKCVELFYVKEPDSYIGRMWVSGGPHSFTGLTASFIDGRLVYISINPGYVDQDRLDAYYLTHPIDHEGSDIRGQRRWELFHDTQLARRIQAEQDSSKPQRELPKDLEAYLRDKISNEASISEKFRTEFTTELNNEEWEYQYSLNLDGDDLLDDVYYLGKISLVIYGVPDERERVAKLQKVWHSGPTGEHVSNINIFHKDGKFSARPK